jgi:hypothetical protein
MSRWRPASGAVACRLLWAWWTSWPSAVSRAARSSLSCGRFATARRIDSGMSTASLRSVSSDLPGRRCRGTRSAGKRPREGRARAAQSSAGAACRGRDGAAGLTQRARLPRWSPSGAPRTCGRSSGRMPAAGIGRARCSAGRHRRHGADGDQRRAAARRSRRGLPVLRPAGAARLRARPRSGSMLGPGARATASHRAYSRSPTPSADAARPARPGGVADRPRSRWPRARRSRSARRRRATHRR